MSNPTGKGGAQPGEVRNPRGRPKNGESLTDVLRAVIHKNGRRARIAEVIAQKCEDGDIRFIEFAWNRIEGAVPRPVEVSGPDGGAIPIQHYDAAAAVAAATAGSEDDPAASG